MNTNMMPVFLLFDCSFKHIGGDTVNVAIYYGCNLQLEILVENVPVVLWGID
jgi:hypothetical protein